MSTGESPIGTQNLVDIYGRLAALHKLLTNKTSKFKYSTAECMKLYKDENASIIQDIFTREKENESIINLFRRYFSSSRSIKFLLFHDLQVLWKKDENITIQKFIDRFISQVGSKQVEVSGSFTRLNKCDTANSIVLFAALSLEPLIACLLAINFKNQNIRIQDSTIKLLLRCLTSYNGKEIEYYNFGIMRLMDCFPDIELDDKEVSEIIDFTLHDKDIYFVNMIFQKLRNKIQNLSIVSENLSNSVSSLIELNINHGQIDKAFEIWKFSQPFSSIYGNVGIVSKLMKHGNEIQARTLVKEFKNSKDHLLQESIIQYYGSKAENWLEIQQIVSQIQPPLQRSTLSALLLAFLSFGKDAESQKVLDTILKSRNKLELQDLNSIVKHLLKNESLDKCMELVKRSEIGISKDAYMTILQHLLATNQQEQNLAFVNEMCKRLQKSHFRSCDDLLPILVNYLIQNHNILIARSFLSDILKEVRYTSNSKLSELPNLEKWHLPNDLYKVLLCSSKSVHSTLIVLLNLATLQDDLDVIKWCILELRYNGTLVKDILNHIRTQNERIYQKYFDV